MSSSELDRLVAELAKGREIPIDKAWMPAVGMHLQRLSEAAKIIQEAKSTATDLAARFEP